MRKIFLTTALLLVATSLPTNLAFAQSFVVSGELVEVRVPGDRTNITDFQFLVNGPKWLAKFGVSGYSPQYLSSQIGCDGTNLYFLNYLDRSAFGEGGAKTNFILANGLVKAETVPPFDYYRTAQLWLAFSYRHYKHSWTDCLPCTLIHPVIGSNFCLKAETKSDHTDPGFLISATTWADGTAILSSGMEVQLPAPFQNGYKNGDFSVLDSTNFQGISVPTAFQFKAFNTMQNGQTSNDLALVYTLYGKVLVIRTNLEKFMPPRLTTKTFVQDYRVPPNSEIEYVRYYTTNKWADTTQPSYSALVRDEAEINKRKLVDASSPRYIARYFVISAFLVSPLIFIGVYRILQRRRPS